MGKKCGRQPIYVKNVEILLIEPLLISARVLLLLPAVYNVTAGPRGIGGGGSVRAAVLLFFSFLLGPPPSERFSFCPPPAGPSLSLRAGMCCCCCWSPPPSAAHRAAVCSSRATDFNIVSGLYKVGFFARLGNWKLLTNDFRFKGGTRKFNCILYRIVSLGRTLD